MDDTTRVPLSVHYVKGGFIMRKILSITIGILICLAAAQALAEQDGLYTYSINPDNTVTITGFDWKNNHGDIYIPEMLGNRVVSAIGEKAFSTTRNTAVKITLPDNIKSIGEQAFRGVAITYVNIPMNTVEIGGGAFAQCTVSRFNVDNKHQVFATIDNALYNKQSKTLIAWPENKEISMIPNGIVNIGDYAFYKRSDFPKKTLVLPDTIQSIGEYAFAEIKPQGNEKNIKIDIKQVSSIEDYAFYQSWIEFTSPLMVADFGNHCFEGAHLTLLGERERAKRNHEVYLSTVPFKVGDFAFYNCDSYDHNGHTSYDFSLENVVSIGKKAFSSDKYRNWNIRTTQGYTTLEFSFLEYIGESAFENNEFDRYSGYSEDLPDWLGIIILSNSNLTTIPANAFMNARIQKLRMANSVKSIDERAFMNCIYLRTPKQCYNT